MSRGRIWSCPMVASCVTCSVCGSYLAMAPVGYRAMYSRPAIVVIAFGSPATGNRLEVPLRRSCTWTPPWPPT
jgi:hypothetical protein